MDLGQFLTKGVKPLIVNPSAPGEILIKPAPQVMLQDAKTIAVDMQSEWIVLGYQFNANASLPPMDQPAVSSFFLENGLAAQGGQPISPTHSWVNAMYSPFIDCLFRCGLGNPLYLNLLGGVFSAVFYIWDPNYQNTRRTNF